MVPWIDPWPQVRRTETDKMSIYIIKNEAADQAEYLREMLALWGGAFAEVIEAKNLSLIRDAEVILIPPDSVIGEELLSALPGMAKHLIAIAPTQDTLRVMGIDSCLPYADDERVSWLRLCLPLLGGYSHYSLPVVGRRVQAMSEEKNTSLPPETNVTACLYETFEQTVDRPVIWSTQAHGVPVTVIAYDLVECYRNLRQGFPRFADWRPKIDLHARPCDLFGPDWENQCPSPHLPLADFHGMLLLELVERALGKPTVRFWQLPGKSKSVILVSGDEDNFDPAHNEKIFSFLDSIQATMTVYILMDGTKTTPDQMQAWQKRGHRFSVHPYPKTREDQDYTPRGDVLKKIEMCFADYESRYHQPMRTVRNHRLFWTGYDEIPKLWEKLGIEMDCNYGYNYRFRGMSGLFISPPASLPVSFLDRNFKRLRVYQQPCHLGDDTCFKPEGHLSRKLLPELSQTYAHTLITQILEPTGTPFAVCFHPGNFATYGREAEERFLIQAKQLGSKICSDEAWLDFWQLRGAWRIASQRWEEGILSCELKGERPAHDLSITLPGVFQDKPVIRITIDGQEVRGEAVNHFGQKRFLVPIPDGIEACQLKITYN